MEMAAPLNAKLKLGTDVLTLLLNVSQYVETQSLLVKNVKTRTAIQVMDVLKNAK